MSTLSIRDVPSEGAEALTSRAAARGQSLSACVDADLASLVARPRKAELLECLRARSRAGAPSGQRILAEAAGAPLASGDRRLAAAGHRAQVRLVSNTDG